MCLLNIEIASYIFGKISVEKNSLCRYIILLKMWNFYIIITGKYVH